MALVGFASPLYAAPHLSPCQLAARSVKEAVAADPAKVLVIVADKVSENPNCGCEMMKAAIKVTKASPELVAAIFEASARSAPEMLDTLISCALAAAPDASNQIQAAAVKINPNATHPSWVGNDGNQNPLDPPGGDNGGNAGNPTLHPQFPTFPPVIINPPFVTEVD